MKEILENHNLGRRRGQRHKIQSDLNLSYRNSEGQYLAIKGKTLSLSEIGLSCKLDSPIPTDTKHVQIEVTMGENTIKLAGSVAWLTEDKDQCGIRLEEGQQQWTDTIIENLKTISTPNSADRRETDRRSADLSTNDDRRSEGRRFTDFIETYAEDDEIVQNAKVKAFLRSKSTSFTAETIRERREWIAKHTNTPLEHIAVFSEKSESFKGKIENAIGVAHIPLGLAGPLKINGDHAKGIFFAPLATTEGALVTSYTLGSHIVTRSGGANVTILKNELRIGPMFVFEDLRRARAFVAWLKRMFPKIKELAESTSHHLVLNQLSQIINGGRVILNFHYNTADAMGMNMACNATEFACQFITASVKPNEFWLRSNFNANKKATANNFINGYGKTVTADVTIPRKLLTYMNCTPEDMETYFARTLLADVHSVQIGANGHFANGITALYIACGQDVALVANAHLGISNCEVNKKGDLYVSVYLPNILAGTVGGGTGFGTGAECLKMLGCYGGGKVLKFTEIVAALALAGEISICASVANGTYVLAHETFGRNRPENGPIY